MTILRKGRGAYHWTFDSTNMPSGYDKLTWGVTKAIELGLNTIRVPLGHASPSTFGIEPTPLGGTEDDYLVKVAKLPQFVKLFDHPQFHTYMLTSYTPQGYVGAQNNWANIDHSKEQIEYQRLATFLKNRFPDKDFIIFNWEGDNAIVDKRAYVTAFQTWTMDRFVGIEKAHASNVLAGIETNCPKAGLSSPCDQAVMHSVILNTLPAVVGYSTWMTFSPLISQSNPTIIRETTEGHIDSLLDSLAPYYTADQLVISEFGRAGASTLNAFEWMQSALGAFDSRGIPLSIYWQVLENGFNNLKYGAFDEQMRLTQNGEAIRHFAY